MIVTDDWLKRWMTPGGAYTRKQLNVIGVDWPPAKGWKGRVIGSRISDTAAAEFELLAGAAVVADDRTMDMFGDAENPARVAENGRQPFAVAA